MYTAIAASMPCSMVSICCIVDKFYDFDIINLRKRLFLNFRSHCSDDFFTVAFSLFHHFSPRKTERLSTSAAFLSSGERYVFLELFASPSSSRMIGQPWMESGIFKSFTIRLMIANCCASFCPKYALSGVTMLKSLDTTVQNAAEVNRPA